LAPSTKTGPEIMDQITKEPTLDEFMCRDPKDLTIADRRRMVKHLREERAQFIAKEK